MTSKLQKNSSSSGAVGYDHLLKLLVIGDSGKEEGEECYIIYIFHLFTISIFHFFCRSGKELFAAEIL